MKMNKIIFNSVLFSVFLGLNSLIINAQDIIVKDHLFYFGDDNITVRITSNSTEGEKDYIFFAPHDDENAAVEATLRIIKDYGGELVELMNSGRFDTESRYITFLYKGFMIQIDPNRMFSRDKDVMDYQIDLRLKREYFFQSIFTSRKKVRNYTRERLKILTDSILHYLEPYDYVIAVHNNWSNSPKSFNLLSYFDPCSVDGMSASKYHYNRNYRPSEFYIVTDEDVYNMVKEEGMSVVLQVPCPKDDGSFSVYSAYEGINYLNCEVKRDFPDLQYEMLEKVVLKLEGRN